ncbi:helix-turn-helix domain-containing protein [Acrocarpospora catenulata]|uniref:helix-turn-helix domain-containing protein n=1 Tax=Acrocarpospora catenulata TaxID=2836182 RepID=UPI001BDA5E61|nr:ImmA/IrrE family metallo-endopeptidase [Acrocarpospora catenulata]
MNEQSVGARIAALRAVRGITGAELGQALGLTKSQVSKIENGTRKLDVSEVALVAEALGVTLAEVLGVSRKSTLALAARVMSEPGQDETRPARRRVRQLLESEAALSDAVGLRPAPLSTAGTTVMRRAEAERLTEGSPVSAGARLAAIVREELGLGRAPIADLPALCERHFGLNALVWPIGKAVSGLCAHGADVAVILVSSSYPRGHQRFTGAHELAHHILGDPREVIVETDVFMVRTPAEQRANAFAAALLMPVDGLHEVIAGHPLDEGVLGELMREFDVSYRALVYRLADRSVRLLSDAQRDAWLAQTPTNVLRAAGDLTPHDLTAPDETRRLPPRLWMAAQQGYQNGHVGLGVLSSLLDEDPDILYARLADASIQPPAVQDDLADL